VISVDAPVTDKGFCWNTVGVPVVGDTCVAGTYTEGGTFTGKLTGLSADNTYYVRAYATNTRGTAYGNQLSYNTPGTPKVDTAVTNIYPTAVDAGGTVTADAMVTVTFRGVCWSTEPISSTTDPTSISHIDSDVAGTGTFTVSITSLTKGTKYYVRAYAGTGIITVLGNEVEFETTSGPAVTTSSVTNKAATSATVNGNVTSDSGSEVTAKGVCWSQSADPDINGSCKAYTTGGTGEFAVDISDLSPGTTYHVRAYATNAVETGYGADLEFDTLCLPGDVDGDGDVDLSDAVMALKIMTEVPVGIEICNTADVNGDSKIGIEEVIYILRSVLNVQG
jgi:hypothetical protein